jgi:hypothetical protein
MQIGFGGHNLQALAGVALGTPLASTLFTTILIIVIINFFITSSERIWY